MPICSQQAQQLCRESTKVKSLLENSSLCPQDLTGEGRTLAGHRLPEYRASSAAKPVRLTGLTYAVCTLYTFTPNPIPGTGLLITASHPVSFQKAALIKLGLIFSASLSLSPLPLCCSVPRHFQASALAMQGLGFFIPEKKCRVDRR